MKASTMLGGFLLAAPVLLVATTDPLPAAILAALVLGLIYGVRTIRSKLGRGRFKGVSAGAVEAAAARVAANASGLSGDKLKAAMEQAKARNVDPKAIVKNLTGLGCDKETVNGVVEHLKSGDYKFWRTASGSMYVAWLNDARSLMESIAAEVELATERLKDIDKAEAINAIAALYADEAHEIGRVQSLMFAGQGRTHAVVPVECRIAMGIEFDRLRTLCATGMLPATTNEEGL